MTCSLSFPPSLSLFLSLSPVSVSLCAFGKSIPTFPSSAANRPTSSPPPVSLSLSLSLSISRAEQERAPSGPVIEMEAAMARRVAFLVACLLLALAVGATPVNYCDQDADYAVQVKEVQINPDPVVRGKPANFTLPATTRNAISGGKLIIDVKYFGVHVHQETHELCKETSCPVSGGDFLISHQEILPAFTPPGIYTLTMKMMGEGESQLTCVSFGFRIGLGSPVDDS